MITYFNSGSEVTFPLFVWGAARVGVPPQVNVIGTVIFVVALGPDAREHPAPATKGNRMSLPDDRPLARGAPAGRPRPPVAALHAHGRRTATREVPIIVRGDGCYLEDSNGKRYLDALAGLFSVNIGYGFGEEIGQAALEQMRELPFYTNWSYAHPRAIELAPRSRRSRRAT